MEERASGRQLPPIEHPEHRIRIHSSDDNLPAVVEVPKYKPDAGLRRSNSSPTGNRASRLDHVPVTTPEPIEDYVDEDEDPAPLASLPPLRRSKTTPSRPDNPNSERASEASRTSPKRESLSVYGTTATDASPALMRHRTVGGEANGAISFSSHVESMLSLGARESLGKPASNNDGWMGPPYDKDGVTTRTKGRRTVCLYRPVDVLLFDRVARWKMKHKGKTKEQAWDNFAGPHMNQVDAIVKLHYGVDRYDYILKFRSSADPRPELNRKTFEKKLLMRGVIIEREQSVEDPKDYFVKVVVPFHVLCTEAQVLKLRMPQSTNEDYAARATEIGGSLTTLADRFKAWASIRDKLIYPTAVMSSRQAQPCSPFQKKKLHTFVGGDVEKNLPRDIQMNFFRDSYRSLMAHHMITGVEITIKTLTGKSDRKEGIPYLLNEGIYTALFHDHDDTVPLATRDPFLPASLSRRSFLIKEWVSKYFRAQPMEEISSYCGEKVAFYFAFFGFYNKWLVIACLFGLIVTLYGLTKYAVEDAFDWTVIFDNEMTPVFGAITSLWAVLLPYVWRRQSTFWAWRWSTMDFEKEESKRPQFKSTAVRKSPVTGKQELYFSSGKRLLRQLASVGVMFMWLGAIAISIAGQVSLGAYLSPKIRNNIAVSTITSMLGLISIFLMKIPFFKVVRQLNEWENYRTE
ncbi:Anoctamin-3 [Irineochytrium annulatum]|nr:Anoctamin-3 [Irineochytrium annulatum]